MLLCELCYTLFVVYRRERDHCNHWTMSRPVIVESDNHQQHHHHPPAFPPSAVSSISLSSSVGSLSSSGYETERSQLAVADANSLFDAWPRKAAYAVAEILNTENRYINDLHDIIQVYRSINIVVS